MKKGVPATAQMTPVGMSPGRNLETASAAVSAIPPAAALAGSSSCMRGPVRRLAACGITSPMKPTAPAIDTDTAVPIATEPRTAMMVDLAFSPRHSASFLPSSSTFICLAREKRTQKTAANAAAPSRNDAGVEERRLPKSHLEIAVNAPSSAYEMASICSEPVKDPVTKPASTTVEPLERMYGSAEEDDRMRSAVCATSVTTPSERHEPVKLAAGNDHAPSAEKPARVAIVAKSEAPPTVPRRYGSASGFLSTLWRAVPETDS